MNSKLIIASILGAILVVGVLSVTTNNLQTTNAGGKCSKTCEITAKNVKLEDVDKVTIVIPQSGGSPFNDTDLKAKDQNLQNQLNDLSQQLGNLSNSAITSLSASDIIEAPPINETGDNTTLPQGNTTG